MRKLRMDSRTWLKFCRDAGIVNQELDRTRIDLIFTKTAGRKQKSVDFDSFLEMLRAAAVSRETTYALLVMHIIESRVSPTVGGHMGSARFQNKVMDVKDQTLSAYATRRADITDLDEIVRLAIALASATKRTAVSVEESQVRLGVEVGLHENTDTRYWVVVYAGSHKPVGFASTTKVWNDWTARNDWVLRRVYVEPEHRRRMLGKRLIQAVKSDALDAEIGEILVNLQICNLTGKRFLEVNHFMSDATKFIMTLDNFN